jgi:two-component system, NtrC family, nitrogen regulation response regulator GlnG
MTSPFALCWSGHCCARTCPHAVSPSPREVLQALETGSVEDSPQVLVSDIRMPGGSGLDLLSRKSKTLMPGLPVIIMTAFSDLDSAVSAFQGGAFEYLPKPFDLAQSGRVDSARGGRKPARASGHDWHCSGAGNAGPSPGHARCVSRHWALEPKQCDGDDHRRIRLGKELVARALHKHSQRAQGPFVAINTAAIPKDLLESELFGHERGAFTGAQTMRRGRFEQADGGTLFLDEIGDMPFDLQTRLLRVLSDGNFYRVGGHSAIKTNVRVIAATHQNLEQRVARRRLPRRLVSPLECDSPALAALARAARRHPCVDAPLLAAKRTAVGCGAKRISDSAIALLQAFAFPGNVRQLENICHWLTVMAPAQAIEPKDLPPEVVHKQPGCCGHPIAGNAGQRHLQAIRAHNCVWTAMSLEPPTAFEWSWPACPAQTLVC